MPFFSFVARHDKMIRRFFIPVEQSFDDIRRNQRNVYRRHEETVISVFARRPDARLNGRKHPLLKLLIEHHMYIFILQKIIQHFRFKTRHDKNIIDTGLFKMIDEYLQRIMPVDLQQRLEISHPR